MQNEHASGLYDLNNEKLTLNWTKIVGHKINNFGPVFLLSEIIVTYLHKKG
ncbi:hypothetical protein [Metabacillus niabensis]|uniref:hypothetical protein n=1 Tax=Metabacillus niabensis TaxID=324854 RepID=UPI001CFABECD|nr:hypothetical protein [Metabacillus niabensis]